MSSVPLSCALDEAGLRAKCEGDPARQHAAVFVSISNRQAGCIHRSFGRDRHARPHAPQHSFQCLIDCSQALQCRGPSTVLLLTDSVDRIPHTMSESIRGHRIAIPRPRHSCQRKAIAAGLKPVKKFCVSCVAAPDENETAAASLPRRLVRLRLETRQPRRSMGTNVRFSGPI